MFNMLKEIEGTLENEQRTRNRKCAQTDFKKNQTKLLGKNIND